MDLEWTKLMDAPWPARGDASISCLPRDRILLCGGSNDSGCALNDVWLFEGSKWMQLLDAPWKGRSRASMTCLPNGAALLCGGQTAITSDRGSLREVWCFADDVWTQLAEAPWHSRCGAALCCLVDGTALLCGGSESGSCFHDVWLFAEGTWTQLPDAPWEGRDRASLTGLADGTALLCGGYGQGKLFNDVWHFENHRWIQLPGAPWEARDGAAMTCLADGMVLLCGGCAAGSRSCGDIWSFADGVWTPLLYAPWKGRANSSFTSLADGAALLCGGERFEKFRSVFLRDVWLVVPKRHTVLTCNIGHSSAQGVKVSCLSLAGNVMTSVWLERGEGVQKLRAKIATALAKSQDSLSLVADQRMLSDDMDWPFENSMHT